jgi:thioester reductase-like protein
MIKTWVGLGTAPEVDAETNMVPVDYVSRAIVRLSLRDESLGKRFHLANFHPVRVDDLVAWIEAFGFPLECIPYDKWRAGPLKPIKGPRHDALYSMAPLLSMSAAADGPALVGKVPEFDCRNTTEALSGTELSCPPVDAEIMENYLVYLVRSGFLNSPTGG